MTAAPRWDAIVIGSGFGGAMAAHALVHAGWHVLMLERGSWVARGPENWGPKGAGLVTPHYSTEAAYRVASGGRRYETGAWHCVGGASVFYGGASFRYRERDFEADPHIVGDSGAAWPFAYDDLEPYYGHAESLLGVAGETGADPTEPWRSAPFPHRPTQMPPSSTRIADAARRAGLHPSRIPLAISYGDAESGRRCISCDRCDGYACAAEAKNDIATGILPELQRNGLALRPNTVVVRLVRERTRITGVEYVDRVTGERGLLTSRVVVLAAGALASPHLLLASGLDAVSSAPHAVGRYLVRHRNRVVFGVYLRPPNPERAFDKHVAIHDLYNGAPGIAGAPEGPLGGIQQLTPPAGLVRAYLPPVVRIPAARLVSHATGLLVIAEDQPRQSNGVSLHRTERDRYGLPRLEVRHEYTSRDERSAGALVTAARSVLREAEAPFIYVHDISTFSHALGTVRMGPDEHAAPLDADGRFRGLDNLYVTDGSALPRSAGVNPSLTIAANALRIGARLAGSSAHGVSGTQRARRSLPVQHTSYFRR